MRRYSLSSFGDWSRTPTSLVAQLLQAKYYMNGDVFTATLGFKPSYTWHSILGVRDIVLKGSRWLVGDRLSIEAWNSRWLPRPSTFKVITPRPSHLRSARVCDLIDYENACWHESLVRDYVLPIDAEVMLAMPLCASWPRDKLIWHYYPDGFFSVRSAYHMIMRAKLLSVEGSSCPQQNVWKMI